MENEIIDLLDSAIYREIASEALYLALQDKTQDPGASELMRELAEEERKHSQWIIALRDKGKAQSWHKGAVADLKITEYLMGADRLDGAGLQDTLIFAMKREQHSLEFYSRMMGAMRTGTAKRLCQRLANEELRHKLKLEILYDGLFLGED